MSECAPATATLRKRPSSDSPNGMTRSEMNFTRCSSSAVIWKPDTTDGASLRSASSCTPVETGSNRATDCGVCPGGAMWRV